MIKKYRLIYLAILLLGFNILLFLLLPRFRFDSIVIHHSASWAGNYETIKKFHKKKYGWRDAGYHLILSNGSTKVPLGYLEATNRYRYLSYSLATRDNVCNLVSLHLCVIGNFDEREVPRDLWQPLAFAIKTLQEKYGISRDEIKFHRDCNGTACPGQYMTQEFITTLLSLEFEQFQPGMRQQQVAVIDDVVYSIYTFPRIFVLISLILSAIIAVVWIVTMRVLISKRDE